MKQILLLFATFFSFQSLSAQDVAAVLFNRDCMNQLEYQYSYPNLKGENSVWAYSMKPNVLENYIFMTDGAGHYAPELPEGTVNCRLFDVDEALVTRINRGTQQMEIVFQRQSGGYWVMPVKSATLVARNGAKYWLRSLQSSFQFDTIRMINEQNLAVAGSPTAAYFSSAKLNKCLLEYSFHCEPVKTSQNRSDILLIPSIGIVNDRTGTSASQALENEIQLIKINGKTLEEYLSIQCPAGSEKMAISGTQKTAIDPMMDENKEISSIRQKERESQSPATYSNSVESLVCGEDWEPGTHIVQKGENLRAIARTYMVTEQQLIKWNNIRNPDQIEVCQKIWLRSPSSSAGSQGLTKTQIAPYEKGKTVRPQGMDAVAKNTQTVAPSISKPATNAGLAKDQSLAPELPNKIARRTHTVARGEYLSKIAKSYGCPEDCIRLANGMPLEGDEPLSIGQQLVIPECYCTLDGKPLTKPATTNTEKVPTPKKTTPVTDNQPVSPVKKPRKSILEDSEIPQQYGSEEPSPEPQRVNKPRLNEESTLYDDPATYSSEPKPSISNVKKEVSKNKVPLFKEHHVKQGENLKSIAAKYKVDPAELSQVNGLAPNENLTPGKLILIPIEDQ